MATVSIQPPSGGCVLKQLNTHHLRHIDLPAAFGRLCVETTPKRAKSRRKSTQPPSGGCVLKLDDFFDAHFVGSPAAFGRLCVETGAMDSPILARKPAAFGRLCVETTYCT